MKKRKPSEPNAPEMTHGAVIARRFTIMVVALVVLLLWGLVLNVNSGSVKIPVGEVFTMVWKAIRYKIANIFVRGQYAEQLDAVLNADLEHAAMTVALSS